MEKFNTDYKLEKLEKFRPNFQNAQTVTGALNIAVWPKTEFVKRN